MHPPAAKTRALELIAAGLNDCEVARRTGIARSTIRDWRTPTYVSRGPKLSPCPRCWRPARPMSFTPEDYCELLGLYLGAGCISEGARTQRLRITLDNRYPQIIDDTSELLGRCFGVNRVGRNRGGGRCTVVSVYCKHLACLFPQHGAGRKHHRSIALEDWQRELVHAAPWHLLKGLIRSDGSVFVNRTGPYEYTSFCFCNRSRDIAELFVGVCTSQALRPRLTVDRGRGVFHVRLNRRRDVARLLERVGTKI